MGVRLPPEYQETEWIEGTRNLHLIDTGIPGNRNTLIIEAKVKPGDLVQYAPLWGNYRGENYNVTRLIAYASNSILSYINTKAGRGTSAVAIPPLFGTGKTFVIRQERTRLIIDGTAYTIPASVTASENSGNIAINASTTGTPSPGTYTTQRWYYFRIFDGEIILRDFIPCYRKSDMIAGMYDLVSNAFFANARTGKTSEFTAGPDVIDSISPWLVARRRMLMARKPARLPAEYKEVEYLQSAGGQCIDTGFSGRSRYSAWYTISFDSITTTLQQVFASTSTGDQRLYFPYVESNGYWAYGYRTVKNTNVPVNVDQKYSVYAKMITGEQIITVDGNEIASGTSGTAVANGTNLFLFAANATNRRYSYAKIYDFRLYDHTEERYVADYVPCYRKSDNKPGMYDLIAGSFLTNRNSGADFVVGPEIN